MPFRAYPGWSFALEALHYPDVLFAETLELKLTPESFINPFGSTGFGQRLYCSGRIGQHGESKSLH